MSEAFICRRGGSGGAALNIDFGADPPSDTSKLWVPLSKKPDFVECSPVLNYGSMYAEIVGTTGTNDSYTPGYQNCMVGDWIYFIGPCIYDTTTQLKQRSAYLRRYNVKTGALENVIQVYTQNTSGGYRGMCGIAVNGKLYFFGGVYYTSSSSSYAQNYNVYIFDLSTNTGTWKTYGSSEAFGVYSSKMSCCAIGKKIYITRGLDEYNSTYSNSPYLYEFDTESLTYKTIASITGKYGSSCFAAGGKVYVFGGYLNSDGDLYEIDPTSGSRTKKLTGFPSNNTLGIYAAPSIQINDKVLIFGNNNNSTTLLNIYQYDIVNNIVLDTGYKLIAQTSNTAWGISGNSVYFLGGDSYNRDSINVQKFTFQTTLQNNHLFLQADFGFDNPFPIISDKNTKITAYLCQAYLGDSNNIAQPTNAYIYDAAAGEWKSLSGESYVADMLNALNVLGVN